MFNKKLFGNKIVEVDTENGKMIGNEFCLIKRDMENKKHINHDANYIGMVGTTYGHPCLCLPTLLSINDVYDKRHSIFNVVRADRSTQLFAVPSKYEPIFQNRNVIFYEELQLKRHLLCAADGSFKLSASRLSISLSYLSGISSIVEPNPKVIISYKELVVDITERKVTSEVTNAPDKVKGAK